MEKQQPKPLAAVSSAVPEKERGKLAGYAEVIPLPPDPNLPEAVAAHPDMILCEVAGTLFFSRRYAEAYPALIREIAEKSGKPVVLSDAPRSPVYPEDAGCNAFVWEREDGVPLLVGRLDILFPEIPHKAEEEGIRAVHVRQGYAACSCIPLPSMLLTSDWGIMRALRTYSDAVCWVPSDGILLPGYDQGFLGGASGVLRGDKGAEVFFFGDPSSMEYAETLSRMLDAAGADFHLLAEDHPLTDRGGIRFIHPEPERESGTTVR